MYTLAATNTISGISGTATAITYTIFGMELSAGVETYYVLGQGQLATSIGTLYTVPGSTSTFVRTIILSNQTSSAVTGNTLTINGTGGANQILSNITIPANGTVTLTDFGVRVVDSSGKTLVSNQQVFAPNVVLPATTTPLALSVSGTSGSSSPPARINHKHQSPGGITTITSATGGINSTETSVVQLSISAIIQRGTSFRIVAYGTCTSSASNTCNFRVRFGTAGNNTDTQMFNLTTTSATSGTNVPFYVELFFTVYAVGVAGINNLSGFVGGGLLINNGITGISTTAAVPFNEAAAGTGVQNFNVASGILQFSYQTTTNVTTTCTFQLASIEVTNM